MAGLRDYESWHADYDDPTSTLSRRLALVQAHVRHALDAHAGPIRVMSSCAGDGRDVIGVLAERPDADRVAATLVEINPRLADRARATAAAAGLRNLEVRCADAGRTDAYAGSVPAHVVLLVGIFGNISAADIERTIRAAPAFCEPGAMLLWSRSTGDEVGDINDTIRGWFAAARFTELDYQVVGAQADGGGPGGGRAGLGAMRYDGPPTPLADDRPLFTFVR